MLLAQQALYISVVKDLYDVPCLSSFTHRSFSAIIVSSSACLVSGIFCTWTYLSINVSVFRPASSLPALSEPILGLGCSNDATGRGEYTMLLLLAVS